MLKNIPVNMQGYGLMVTEEPTQKTRKKNGVMEWVTDREGVNLFVVSLFVKRRAQADSRPGKGEEINVTLAMDPGEGFAQGMYVELIDATLSPYSFKNDEGETISGISFFAKGLTPVG